MTHVISRFFGQAMPQLRMPFTSEPRLPVDQIKQKLRALLADCHDTRAQRVTYRISGAVTADELWQIRSELHQCISQLHSQAEAAARINSVLHVFAGWVPTRQLAKI